MANYNMQQVRGMSDSEFLAAIRKYSLPSQWADQSAFEYALSRLTHMNGQRYLQGGNIKMFTNSIR